MSSKQENNYDEVYAIVIKNIMKSKEMKKWSSLPVQQFKILK